VARQHVRKNPPSDAFVGGMSSANVLDQQFDTGYRLSGTAYLDFYDRFFKPGA